MQDNAWLSTEVTQFDLVCLKHGLWCYTAEQLAVAGHPVPTNVLKCARRFHRARQEHNAKEVALAFETSYHAFRRILEQRTGLIHCLTSAWGTRLGASASLRPSLFEIAFPEIATLATVLLSPQCTQATRQLSGSRKGISCSDGRAAADFTLMADRVFQYVQPATESDRLLMSDLVARAGLDFLTTAIMSTLHRTWHGENVERMATTRASRRIELLRQQRPIPPRWPNVARNPTRPAPAR